jgi:hypothetical protein
MNKTFTRVVMATVAGAMVLGMLASCIAVPVPHGLATDIVIVPAVPRVVVETPGIYDGPRFTRDGDFQHERREDQRHGRDDDGRR